ncbi:MAG: Phospholipase precursor [Verrucomicrobiota bacterium]|jgi:alkaline phosphatase D
MKNRSSCTLIHRNPMSINRRLFLQGSSALVLPVVLLARAAPAQGSGPHLATGTRVGEVTASSAIVWARLTAEPLRNNGGLLIPGRHKAAKAIPVPVEQLEGACPGTPGRLRLRYGPREDLQDAKICEWVEVGEKSDFAHHFHLKDLQPSTLYYYVAEAAQPGSGEIRGSFRGRFETATAPTQPSELTFCVMTCQGYPDRDHKDGHEIYPSMLALKPRFAVLSGDLVYYDSDAPSAVTPRLARFHWERMFSLPRLLEFNRSVATYWQKDDHDTVKNDAWPGQKLGELTFAEGEAIFQQQAPLGEGVDYRTVRWGRDLQVWFTEGRDFRSPNTQNDGPDKTIWGKEQKEWFKRTVLESAATWKILVSPTPLVGPDRGKGKNDNHANLGFQHEGDELRQWMQQHVPDNFFVICGDRHWQYHSIHPETKVREFSCGPASDEHAGGSPGENKDYHKFHRVKGGFLAVTLRPEAQASFLKFELRDVKGQVVHTAEFKRPPA